MGPQWWLQEGPKPDTHRGLQAGRWPTAPRLPQEAPRPRGWAKLSHTWLTYWARDLATSGGTWDAHQKLPGHRVPTPELVLGMADKGRGLGAGLGLAPASVHRCQQRDLRAPDPQAVGDLVG